MSRKIQHSARSMPSEQKKEVYVFDRRFQHSKTTQEWLETGGLDWKTFRQAICQTFLVPAEEDYVLVTTERRILDADGFSRLENGATLYMMQKQNQTLEVPTEELINFTPHHDTVVESGTYKYYDSEGKKSLPYALADLVDNALTATANNTGERRIEIRMMFDESLGKPAVIVLDNGCGMTSKQLNNWAVYKLSKFTRDPQSDQGGYARPVHLRRSLNSDISYFGVGGKQAAFYIGKATRMITKSINSPDVHELVISKALFERKDKNKEDTYSTTILNRRPCDFSHVNKSQEQFLQDLIAEEKNKESFTAVVITEVLSEHVQFLKEDFEVWTRQLAHIYHYYIHGVDGNNGRDAPEAANCDSNQMSKIDILISVKTKGRDPDVVHLRNINTDMQSQYIKASVSTFEFKACTIPEAGIVEGILRYHPFLYENETYPEDPDAEPNHHDNDDDDVEADYMNDVQAKKRTKPIFECYWNGRLIPYTTISEFDWCSLPAKGSKVPPECYNRVSGVLFTDDTFKVTENKLTFIDLEKKLKNIDTGLVIKGQRQRINLQKDFSQWLCECHEKFDKQVKFMNYQDTITRTDIQTKRKQHPWATFSSVEWHNKVYKAGDYVKTQKTVPIYHGTVKCFMFYGSPDGDGDVFAPSGQVEISVEPKGLYDSTKIVPLSKLDRNATLAEIKKSIKRDSEKLPHELKVEWPEGNPWEDNSIKHAGSALGPINVQILNKKGESISRISTSGLGKKLSVELKLVFHDPKGDKVINSFVAHYLIKWGYWFKPIEHLVDLGKYTVYLSTILTETSSSKFGDRRLPHHKATVTMTVGKAMQFEVGSVNSSLRVGVPFDIPLHMKDVYGHPVDATSDLTPTLHCSDLEVKYERVKCAGKILTLKNVIIKGKLQSCLEPNPYDLCVTLEGLKDHTKVFKLNLLPGVARCIHVIPKDNPITVENGNAIQFSVIVQDEVGNTTTHPKITVQCQVPKQPTASISCHTGVGTYVTKPIKVPITNGEPQQLTAYFNVPKSSIKEVLRPLLVLPSTKAHRMELYQQDDEALKLKPGEKIPWVAGGVVENLYFRLYDEANKKVEITAAVASKIKVNWTAEMNKNDLIEGKLPDVDVPRKVGEEFFRQVSYQDQSISFSFIIVPIADEAANIKATVPKCTARLGEQLLEPITLELVDQYNNVSKTFVPSCMSLITAEGEGLDKTHLAFKLQRNSCSVLVTGVCFKAGTPGFRELSFTYKSFTCSVKLQVTAGAPARLQLIHRPEPPLQILNGNGIPTPFVIQLCDQWDNPSPDQRVVVKMWPSSEIKINANVLSQPVDAKGQASFKVLCVSGPKGYYQLKFEGIFKKEPIQGPTVNLAVVPDPSKPVRLDVKYDSSVSFIAGDLFPVFSVTVMSDEGSPITRFNPATVSMLCWKGGGTVKTPPNTASAFQCNKPMENEDKRAFYFRGKPIPEEVGKYTVQFCLQEHKNTVPLYSEQITVNVEANKPVKLIPDDPPPAQVVSYSQDIAKRILFENMTLKIVDNFGNAAGQGLNGEVEICIENQNSESTEPHPLFEGKTNCHKIKLTDGEANVPRLAVMKNSPGKHAATYVVLFRPLLSSEPPEPLEPFKFFFSFSHDAQNQEKCLALTRERNKLKEMIRKSTEKLNIRKSLILEYTNLLQNCCASLRVTRQKLANNNLHLPENITVLEVDGIISQKMYEQRQIAGRLRTCRLQDDYQNRDRNILGRVGFLAQVEDDDAAWVISWHIRGDINCVVTTTKEVALDIHHRTGGTQEVLPIENLNDWPMNPLPHISRRFTPVGNPVLALDLFKYPHRETQAQCELVLKNIVQSTIIIDDLESANKYRQMVVRNKMRCPTILTRQGDRVTSNGKFGGKGNKAPPRNQLVMFGAPLPNNYFHLSSVIELLQSFKTSLENKMQYEADHAQEYQTSFPEIQEMERGLESMNKELENAERQLGSPAPAVRRVSPSTGESSGIPAKRSRPDFHTPLK